MSALPPKPPSTVSTPSTTRRRVLAGGSASLAAAPFLSTLAALQSRQALANTAAAGTTATVPGPYGPLAPVADEATGLPLLLLLLPEGFAYRSYGWTGDPMADGQACPGRHDGMAVVRSRQGWWRGRGFGADNDNDDRDDDDMDADKHAAHDRWPGRPDVDVVLIRNHELGLGSLIANAPTYDRGLITVPGGSAFAAGGTTVLRFRGREFVSMAPSIAGTVTNCAGGPTPWGTWLTCEEVGSDAMSADGKKHGYVFEVHPSPNRTSAKPIVAMGRFSHEAVAVDPRTRFAYLTEDDRNKAGFYRFQPYDRSGRPGAYERGGRLQMARVVGKPNADLIVASVGDRYRIEWVDIADPDANRVAIDANFPLADTSGSVSGPFAQGWRAGALRMSRGEGIWYDDGKFYIVDTSTGVDSNGGRGRGDGAVWEYDPKRETLRAIFVSLNQAAANNPDNITVSPRGGIVLCEDGGVSSDEFGSGSRLVGLTERAESYIFAKNNVLLTADQIGAAGKVVAAGDYRGSEFCGACFDPRGRVMFVNIQTPGITFAIWGPWRRGNL